MAVMNGNFDDVIRQAIRGGKPTTPRGRMSGGRVGARGVSGGDEEIVDAQSNVAETQPMNPKGRNPNVGKMKGSTKFPGKRTA